MTTITDIKKYMIERKNIRINSFGYTNTRITKLSTSLLKGFVKQIEKNQNVISYDISKIRSYYLPMLEMAAEENPEPRNLYYLAREYYYKENFEKALEVFKR